ncbi:MAG: 8-oxo-dGTP diphosphatase MutT [Eggerthellales bacterium]|nr:8-oxo-dGTP diphosphatase MutT [Eggerthellales bacterium]
MKTVEVVAAVIKKEDAIFATQRGYGDFAGGWEFPGGKVEPGETPEQAIVREIQEELETTVAVDGFLTTIDYDYPTFHLTMHCYVCHVSEGRLHLLEHSAAKWLTLNAIDSVEWLPADVAVVEAIRAQKIIG